jgi:hypothetical protein
MLRIPLRAWKGRIVNDEKSVGSAHQPVSLDQQLAFQRSRIPGPRGHEVVQAVVAAQAEPLAHRLHALAIPRTDQAGNVKRAHAPPGPVRQLAQERLEPTLKLHLPTRSIQSHDAPPASETSGESAAKSIRSSQTAKVVLVI